jgi:hypothetical protein
MPSKKVSMKASLVNKTSVYGIMGGLHHKKNSGISSNNRTTSRLVIPTGASAGLAYMRTHNLLSRNPLGSGGVGRMFRLRAGGSSLGSSVKKTPDSLGGGYHEHPNVPAPAPAPAPAPSPPSHSHGGGYHEHPNVPAPVASLLPACADVSGSSICTHTKLNDGCYIPNPDTRCPGENCAKAAYCCKNSSDTWDISNGCIDANAVCAISGEKLSGPGCLDGRGDISTCAAQPPAGFYVPQLGDNCVDLNKKLCGDCTDCPSYWTTFCNRTSEGDDPGLQPGVCLEGSRSITYDCTGDLGRCGLLGPHGMYTVKEGDGCVEIADSLCKNGGDVDRMKDQICDYSESFCRSDLVPGMEIYYDCGGQNKRCPPPPPPTYTCVSGQCTVDTTGTSTQTLQQCQSQCKAGTGWYTYLPGKGANCETWIHGDSEWNQGYCSPGIPRVGGGGYGPNGEVDARTAICDYDSVCKDGMTQNSDPFYVNCANTTPATGCSDPSGILRNCVEPGSTCGPETGVCCGGSGGGVFGVSGGDAGPAAAVACYKPKGQTKSICWHASRCGAGAKQCPPDASSSVTSSCTIDPYKKTDEQSIREFCGNGDDGTGCCHAGDTNGAVPCPTCTHTEVPGAVAAARAANVLLWPLSYNLVAGTGGGAVTGCTCCSEAAAAAERSPQDAAAKERAIQACYVVYGDVGDCRGEGNLCSPYHTGPGPWTDPICCSGKCEQTSQTANQTCTKPESFGGSENPNMTTVREGQQCQDLHSCTQTAYCVSGTHCDLARETKGGCPGGGICTRNICVEGATKEEREKATKVLMDSSDCGTPAGCDSDSECADALSCVNTSYSFDFVTGGCGDGASCCMPHPHNWVCNAGDSDADMKPTTCEQRRLKSGSVGKPAISYDNCMKNCHQPCELSGSSVCTVDHSGNGCSIPADATINLDQNTICCKNTPTAWDQKNGCIDRGPAGANVCHMKSIVSRWPVCFSGPAQPKECPGVGISNVGVVAPAPIIGNWNCTFENECCLTNGEGDQVGTHNIFFTGANGANGIGTATPPPKCPSGKTCWLNFGGGAGIIGVHLYYNCPPGTDDAVCASGKAVPSDANADGLRPEFQEVLDLSAIGYTGVVFDYEADAPGDQHPSISEWKGLNQLFKDHGWTTALSMAQAGLGTNRTYGLLSDDAPGRDKFLGSQVPFDYNIPQLYGGDSPTTQFYTGENNPEWAANGFSGYPVGELTPLTTLAKNVNPATKIVPSFGSATPVGMPPSLPGLAGVAALIDAGNGATYDKQSFISWNINGPDHPPGCGGGDGQCQNADGTCDAKPPNAAAWCKANVPADACDATSKTHQNGFQIGSYQDGFTCENLQSCCVNPNKVLQCKYSTTPPSETSWCAVPAIQRCCAGGTFSPQTQVLQADTVCRYQYYVGKDGEVDCTA